MYPAGELKVLAERRAFLERRIEARREECVEAGRVVAAGVERVITWTHWLKAGSILGAVGTRFFSRRRRHHEEEEFEGEGEAKESWGVKAVRWAPVALRAFRIISSFV